MKGEGTAVQRSTDRQTSFFLKKLGAAHRQPLALAIPECHALTKAIICFLSSNIEAGCCHGARWPELTSHHRDVLPPVSRRLPVAILVSPLPALLPGGLYTYEGSDAPIVSNGRPNGNTFNNNKVTNTAGGVKVKNSDNIVFTSECCFRNYCNGSCFVVADRIILLLIAISR